jgi:hypothetical protein
VDNISTPNSAKPAAKSTTPVLSLTLIRAREIFRMSIPQKSSFEIVLDYLFSTRGVKFSLPKASD